MALKTEIKNKKSLTGIDLFYESNNYIWSGIYRNPTPAPIDNTALVSVGAGITVHPGRIVVIKSIEFSSDGAIEMFFQADREDMTGWAAWALAANAYTPDEKVSVVFGASGGERRITFENGFPLFENSVCYFRYNSRDGQTHAASYIVHGYEISADSNYDTRHKIVCFGDSTTIFPMGNDSQGRPSMGSDLWNFRLTEALNKDGYDCRFVSKSREGRRAIDAHYDLITGRYNGLLDYDACIVSFGHNDCVDGAVVSEASFKECLRQFINPKYRKSNKPVIFLAPTTTDSTVRMSNIVNFRRFVKEVANDSLWGGNENNVWFYDQSLAYGLSATPTTDINFNSSERGAGSRLHPSGEFGHKLIFQNTNTDPDNNINQGGVYPLFKKIISLKKMF